MKADITKKTVSYTLLDNSIAAYLEDVCEEDDQIYIFMNSDTASALTLEHEFKNISKLSNMLFTYHGCKVYLDEDLEYGEVDIR